MQRFIRHTVLFALMQAAVCAVCLYAFAESSRYVPGELLVRFKPVARGEVVNSINEEIGCQVIRKLQFIDVHHMKITSQLSVEEAVEMYNQSPDVEFAEPNYLRHGAQVPDNPRVLNNAEVWPNDPTFNVVSPTYGFQWGLDNWSQTGGVVDADIDAPQMWRLITSASPDVVVAILDSGVDWNHADLTANIWTNLGEIPGDGMDNDSNMYIDDVRGWDFIDNDNDPDDDSGHGTKVAGIVGAEGNNGIGIAGVCWAVQLMPVRILDDSLEANIADVCLGIDYAIHCDARIINLNVCGDDYSHSEEFAIDRANEQGILVVAPAGNDAINIDIPGQERYPAAHPSENLIAVAACNDDDGLSSVSNWGGLSVDLTAPGEDIYSTLPGNSYGYGSGTSMATAHVSGVAALCWSLDPWASQLEIRDLILSQGESLSAADKEKKPALAGLLLTEGRLRAAQNADFADAPLGYPTLWPPLQHGALHLDCGLEWLGSDVSLERDIFNTNGTDTDGVSNFIDNDGYDDGVVFFPPYYCKDTLALDSVSVTVTVSNPLSGRYGGGKFLYLSCFFDFDGNGDWQGVFTCVTPGDAPEHLLIQAVGGPGAASVVNVLPDDVVVIDPSLWGGAATQQSDTFNLYFYSPSVDTVTESVWTRFRLEYNDQLWPTPDNKYLGTQFDYSLFGEVEDHEVDNSCVSVGEKGRGGVVRPMISQSYPTPFSGKTSIQLSLPEAARVTVDVFDVRGRLVNRLIDRSLPGGVYEVCWDGTDSLGRRVPSGVYFFRMQAGELLASRKVVVLH